MRSICDIKNLIVMILFVAVTFLGHWAYAGCEEELDPFARVKATILAEAFNSLKSSSIPSFRWVALVDEGGNEYKASQFNYSLEKTLQAAQIPLSEIGNYRIPRFDDRIQFNVKDKRFEDCPLAVRRALESLIHRDLDFYRILTKAPVRDSELKNLIVAFHNMRNHLRPIGEDVYWLVDPQVRKQEIVELQTNLKIMFPEIPLEMFHRVRGDLDHQYDSKYERPKKILVETLSAFAIPESHPNWFMLAGVRLSLLPYFELPEPAHHLLDLEGKRIRANWKESEAEFDQSSTIEAYRATMQSESNWLHRQNHLVAQPTLEFEPYIGPQVSHFRRENNYSGEILKIEIPGYLFERGMEYASYKPTIQPRYPFKISNFSWIKP